MLGYVASKKNDSWIKVLEIKNSDEQKDNTPPIDNKDDNSTNEDLYELIFECKKEDYYNFIIDSNIISISNFLSKLTTKYNIEDIEIDNESIDDVILKLYEDYEL